jgi:hypothetical protein
LKTELLEKLFLAGFSEVFFSFRRGGKVILLVLEPGPMLVRHVEEILKFQLDVGRDGIVPVDDGVEVSPANTEDLRGANLRDTTLVQEITKRFARLGWKNGCHKITLTERVMALI